MSGTPRALLTVKNQNFTRGKNVPSILLRVLSDGTIECHAIKFGWKDERDLTKTAQLNVDEIAKITSVLRDNRLRDANDQYRLGRPMGDGYVWWDITIDRSPLPRQNIKLFFAGHGDSLPDALKKLGCQILELRRKVYGDASPVETKMMEYYAPACTGAAPMFGEN